MNVGGIPQVEELVTNDISELARPDVIWDLNELPWPWEDNSFDQIHAYEVLEHLGTQGDYKAFFDHFYECYRILKPGGLLFGSTPGPESDWTLAEPGHTRVIYLHTLNFLNQEFYDRKEKDRSCASDYRDVWKGDFEMLYGKYTTPVEKDGVVVGGEGKKASYWILLSRKQPTDDNPLCLVLDSEPKK
jgi:SAM-dependent methyltransferase